MSTSKAIDKICLLAVAAALLLSALFVNGAAFGVKTQERAMGYEGRLFDNSKVHTIDIIIDDWDAFLDSAQSEQYAVCNVLIDGEAFRNVGIRGKGNTSLSSVSSMDSDRYSFKIEFDQYDCANTYYGLDKLSLNNLIQDNTMMKDYLTYQMMNEFGVAAPLCSYVYITVNGEDWGLYLAVEAVEESFLQRNYGNDYGELYKPDSMNMGGGRGNGKDFSFEDFMGSSDNSEGVDPSRGDGMMPGSFDPSRMEGMVPDGFDPSRMEGMAPDGFDPSRMEGMAPDGFTPSQMGGFGMGSGETKLQYIDDNPESYSTIFSSAKTDVSVADQNRLIAALKDLSQGMESAVDAEAVIRYFVVHNYVVNEDSYTGSMIHNYYLYENEGRLSMIPWDYNLAFGTFQGKDASGAVNDDIDAPLSTGGNDRPMIDWIFCNEEYTALYHRYFQEFLHTVQVQSIISSAKALIADYVEKDPTKFCSYEEFESGVETLSAFCTLRSQSIAQQLAGEDADVDASHVNLSAMGTMGGGFGGGDRIPGQSGEMGSPPDMGTTTGEPPRFPEFNGQNTMTPPQEMENKLPGQNGAGQNGFSNTGQMGAAPTQGGNQWGLFLVTLIILMAGLLFVFKFKR